MESFNWKFQPIKPGLKVSFPTLTNKLSKTNKWSFLFYLEYNPCRFAIWILLYRIWKLTIYLSFKHRR